MPTASQTTAPAKPATVPPITAVAQDAHWAATLERLANRTRPRLTMTICDDTDIKDDLERARYALRRVKALAEDDPDQAAVEAAEQQVADAEAAFDAAKIVLTFQAMPRPVFKALKEAHKPTEEQAADNLVINPDTIGPELISAASVDGITVEQATEYLDTWSEGEADLLFSTAWNVQGETRADLGKG
jgi:hypothetical protein